MLLHRRDQRLDQEHVAFAAVGLELDLQAVVGEPLDAGRVQRRAEMLADLLGQLGVGATGEDGDVAHCLLRSGECGPAV